MHCSACGFEQKIEGKFCANCGGYLAQNSAEEESAPQPMSAGRLLAMICFCGFVGFAVLSEIRERSKEKKATTPVETSAALVTTPSATIDPLYNTRLGIAELTQETLRETGCPNCRAAVIADILIITNPQRAPQAVASELLGHKQLKKRFKDAGFRTLRVKQQTGMLADHFDYAIK